MHVYDCEPNGGGVYLGDGEWMSWNDFGEVDPDEPVDGYLPVLEWEDKMKRRFPRADLSVIRQFIRLARAAEEYHDETGKHLDIYGAMGELYGAMVWGIRLHRKPNAEGSDGKLDAAFVEIKTIGPRCTTDRVRVKLSGHFTQLLVVKIENNDADNGGNFIGGFRVSGRLVNRRELTTAKSGYAGIKWSRACAIGSGPPE